MVGLTKKLGRKVVLRVAALATAGITVSGCTYDVGLGYASDGYASGYYDCDPYSPFDNYYDCDNGYGFSNIGYGGGWYDSYWYPGYGYFLFDNYGRRYIMRDNHRRYWGERRHSWYRENRGRNRDGGRYEGHGSGYTDNAIPSTIGWPELHGGRVIEGEERRQGRGDRRRQRGDQWRGGSGNGADAVPVRNADTAQGRGRGTGQGYGRRQRSNDGNGNAMPQPQRERPTAADGNRPPPASGQPDAPAFRPAPAPRNEGTRQPRPQIRSNEGAVERPD